MRVHRFRHTCLNNHVTVNARRDETHQLGGGFHLFVFPNVPWFLQGFVKKSVERWLVCKVWVGLGTARPVVPEGERPRRFQGEIWYFFRGWFFAYGNTFLSGLFCCDHVFSEVFFWWHSAKKRVHLRTCAKSADFRTGGSHVLRVLQATTLVDIVCSNHFVLPFFNVVARIGAHFHCNAQTSRWKCTYFASSVRIQSERLPKEERARFLYPARLAVSDFHCLYKLREKFA